MQPSLSQDSSPVRTHPAASNAKEKSPAFQGASRAFNANAAASAIAPHGNHGALAAASAVGGKTRGQTQMYNGGVLPPMSTHTTGQSDRSRDPSPSHVAASLAVSQAFNRPSHSSGPSLSVQQSRRRPSPLQRMPTAISATDEQSEIMQSPATKTLVQLYESKQNPPIRKTQSVRYVSKPGPLVRSPKPIKPLVRSGSSASFGVNNLQVPPAGTKPQALQDAPNASHHGAAAAGAKLAGPVYEMAIESRGAPSARPEPPEAPPPRGRKQRLGEEGKDTIDLRPKRVTSSAAPLHAAMQPFPNDISKEPTSVSSLYPQYQTSSSSDSIVFPSLKPLPIPRVPQHQPTMSFDNGPPQPAPPRISRDQTRQLSSHMSVDSLANAMVASSLASSRAPSPAKSIPLPPPPRRHHLFHHSHSQELISRTPSPAKPMRHTMRKSPESDDEMEGYKKGKSHLVRKHQHKHHEGDRKRYRTQVTERERKRYEGVWAANKGLHFSVDSEASASTNEVLNIVVRDIWRRSRLPDDVLEEVWDLAVGAQDTDRLGREEFVVGLWLIDQRLKGNKLPIKVSESVWASVRRLPGIKVPKNRYQGR